MSTQTRHHQNAAGPAPSALLQTMITLVRGALERALPEQAGQRIAHHHPPEGGAHAWIEPPTCSVALTAPRGALIVCKTVEHSLTTIIDLPATVNVLPPAVELAVRVIITEAITNVVYHAWATECVVRVWPVRGLRLEVIDDGKGLPPLYRARSGFQLITEQVQQLSGHWQIGAEVGAGTRLAVWLPFPGHTR